MADRDIAFAQFVTAKADGLQRTAYLLCGDWHRATSRTPPTVGSGSVAGYRHADGTVVFPAQSQRVWWSTAAGLSSPVLSEDQSLNLVPTPAFKVA